MLVTDLTTGQLHDIPDAYAQPVAFDGFGNPIGAFPALAALLPAIGSILPGLLKGLFSEVPPGLGYAVVPDSFDGMYGEPYVEPPAVGAYDPYGSFAGMPAMPSGGCAYCGGGYGQAQIIYDGFGNPIGSIPAIASILPAAASFFQRALPVIQRAIPQVANVVQRVLPHAQQIIEAIAPQPAMMPVGSPAMAEEPIMAPPPVPGPPMDMTPVGPEEPPLMPYPPPGRPRRRHRRRPFDLVDEDAQEA